MGRVQRIGIYSITNNITNKKYIGSTTRSFEERWQTHKRQLKSGTHHCKPLQKEWDEYGEEAFSFEIIEFVAEDSSVLDREQYYIDLYSGLYNVNLRVQGGFRQAPNKELMDNVLSLAEQRLSDRRIAAELGISREVVRYYRNRNGVDKKEAIGKEGRPRKVSDSQILEIRRLYKELGFGSLKISKLLNMPRETVRYYIRLIKKEQ